MAFRKMLNIGQGFAAEQERQANRILECQVIIGEKLDMLNNALGQWMKAVSRLNAQAKARSEAQHQAHQERANIHEPVNTQMHANLGQTMIEMRARNAALEVDLDRTKAEFTTYSAKVQAELKETRKEVTRIIQKREEDGKEWGAYMAKAKERDEHLTRQIAQMADELKRTRMEQAQPAETPVEASMADERLHTLLSEGGGNGMVPLPQRPRVEECQTQKMTTLMMTKVITEHPGPEATHQDGQCQIHTDPPNHLIPNNGYKC